MSEIYLRVVIRIRQAVPEHSTVSGAHEGSKKCKSSFLMCCPCWDFLSWIVSNPPHLALWHIDKSAVTTLGSSKTGTLLVGTVYFL